MHRGPSALLCLTLSAVLVVTPSLTSIGDHNLYSSAWAKDGGNNGGASGSGGGNSGGGNSGGGNAGNSNSGKSASSVTGAKSKNSALNPTTASISKANAAVAMAQKKLQEANQAFETALAEPGTETSTLLQLEGVITAAEKSLRKASAKAAALNVVD